MDEHLFDIKVVFARIFVDVIGTVDTDHERRIERIPFLLGGEDEGIARRDDAAERPQPDGEERERQDEKGAEILGSVFPKILLHKCFP